MSEEDVYELIEYCVKYSPMNVHNKLEKIKELLGHLK